MTLQYPCQTLQPYAFITVSENRLLKLRNCADLVLHFFCAKNRWQNKKQCYNHPCVPLYTKAFLGISDCCVRVCGTHPGNILLCMLPKKTPRSNTGSFLFTQKKSPDALLLSTRLAILFLTNCHWHYCQYWQFIKKRIARRVDSNNASGDFLRRKNARLPKPAQGLARGVSQSTYKWTGKILQYK